MYLQTSCMHCIAKPGPDRATELSILRLKIFIVMRNASQAVAEEKPEHFRLSFRCC